MFFLIINVLFKIFKSEILTINQKVLNSILLILIPIIWLLLVNAILKTKGLVVKTKSNRRLKKLKGNTGDGAFTDGE
jgi:hypothetical protein